MYHVLDFTTKDILQYRIKSREYSNPSMDKLTDDLRVLKGINSAFKHKYAMCDNIVLSFPLCLDEIKYADK